MLQLLLGLVLFFGMHSMSIVALPLRDKLAAKSEIGWKLLYAMVSLLGIVLMARGMSVTMSRPSQIRYLTMAPLQISLALALLPKSM